MVEDEEPDDTTHLLVKQQPASTEEWKETPEIARLRLWWGICYANGMGVCGIVLVALGSTLSKLAADCGTTSTDVGTVFIARGIGAISGALMSARLYSPPRQGNHIMVVVLILLAGVLLYMPFVRTIWMLHLTWFAMGLCTATLDTGCQIMTRKVHGVEAGPWLGANTVCFAIAGALVPVIEIATGALFAQFATLATISILNAAALYVSPHPEAMMAQLPPRVGKPKGNAKSRATERLLGKYSIEIVIGAAVFWLIGGKVDTTSYIAVYVKETHVVGAKESSIALLMLWVWITVGRLLGLYDQIQLRKAATKSIFSHLTGWLLTGTFGMVVLALFSRSPWAFWLGISLYGLGNGPCVGYCYDLINRLTVATEEGMAIVMFGLNFGASLVPYLTTVVWDYTDMGADCLVWITLLSMLIPIPLIYGAAAMAASPKVLEPTSKADMI